MINAKEIREQTRKRINTMAELITKEFDERFPFIEKEIKAASSLGSFQTTIHIPNGHVVSIIMAHLRNLGYRAVVNSSQISDEVRLHVSWED